MEPIAEVLELLKRQAELENGLRQPGGIWVTEDLRATRAPATLSAGRLRNSSSGAFTQSAC